MVDSRENLLHFPENHFLLLLFLKKLWILKVYQFYGKLTSINWYRGRDKKKAIHVFCTTFWIFFYFWKRIFVTWWYSIEKYLAHFPCYHICNNVTIYYEIVSHYLLSSQNQDSVLPIILTSLFVSNRRCGWMIPVK